MKATKLKQVCIDEELSVSGAKAVLFTQILNHFKLQPSEQQDFMIEQEWSIN